MRVNVGCEDDEARRPRVILSELADFKEQKNALQELVLLLGNFCIFLTT